MQANITFYGGAGSVTGANFLFDIGTKRILIDCGAQERENHQADENLRSFAYDPSSIDALIITHAHQDHIGRVPKLAHDGFKGVIYSTPATKDLSALMFDDSVNVMRNESEKTGAPMIYQKEDAERALGLWQTHEYHEGFSIGDGRFEFLDAGHILGSAMVKATRGKRTIVFTGDLGNSPEPLLNDTESAEGAQYLLMESVYGDRLHEHRDERAQILRDEILDAQKRNGTLLIPSFSIERTQILLFEIDKMLQAGEIAPIQIYLDAPLATRVNEVFRKYSKLLNEDARSEFKPGNDPFSFKGLNVVATTDESRKIASRPGAKVIIAGAGMSNGGRIRAHEKEFLGDENATVLFVGYQAPGSLGRRIYDGQKSITLDGAHIKIKARIAMLSGYSGHKDRDELLTFVESAGQSLEKVFVCMGEPSAELYLAQRIHDFLGIAAAVPATGETAAVEW